MTLIQRVKSPTPGFFRKIRNTGLLLASIGASVLAVPIALPATVLTIAGYLTVAGGVASAISQATTANDPASKPKGSGTWLFGRHTYQGGHMGRFNFRACSTGSNRRPNAHSCFSGCRRVRKFYCFPVPEVHGEVDQKKIHLITGAARPSFY